MYPLFAAALCSVMLARLFVAAHFPHQCLIGALIGECLPTDSILFQQKVYCFNRKYYIWLWKHLMYPLFAAALCSVMLARLFVAALFPHQCLIGALIGAFLAPALCIYITDPFIWKYGVHATYASSAFLAPALCIYVTDPFIWKYGVHATYASSRAVACHVIGTVVTLLPIKLHVLTPRRLPSASALHLRAFLAPALCIYITDPFIWKYGVHATYASSRAMACHVIGTVVTLLPIKLHVLTSRRLPSASALHLRAFLAPALCIYITDPFIWKYGVHATYASSRAMACHVIGTVVTLLPIKLHVLTSRRLPSASALHLRAFLAPALCIYVTDPFIWKYGVHATYASSRAVACHVIGTVVTAVVAGATYAGLKLCGWDPHWTVKLAFRWCENPETIRVSTTPMYALVVSTGSLLGWALCVTPAVAEYRHYTKARSLIISLFSTGIILMGYQHIQDTMCKADAGRYYAMQFALAAFKPMLLLRVTPFLSMWPFRGTKIKAE
ncbi:hypothetical protein PYW07_011682 [Mythimna separata]|uniref:Uncharacterized protein n=1 Tax=Mythimna separata TaxID=271217 RepID=A0AAD7Y6V8_MYTSE|nr:hypothetical protein PYW07_011682 [Mythimna separata]